ncbi:hypothetical protein PINS_up024013 [Pythium insidiosum]|nr:hypothetical protein PINS_up024013 [Pythium insidiosum]
MCACGTGVARAQTMTFIAMTFTEVLRAYTVRNLKESMFVKHVFGFAYISGFQWFVSLLGAVNAMFWSEITKWVLRCKSRSRNKRCSFELRQLRQRIDQMEQTKPAIQA